MRQTIIKFAVLIPVLLLLFYGLIVFLLWMVQEPLLFMRADSLVREKPDERSWDYEDLWLEVNGEKSHGWWIPLENADYVILFSHGSGRNITGYLDDVALYREAGFSVLLYDYGGYGESSGKASEKRCYADAHAMWDYLVSTRNIAPDHIILAGSSLGGAMAVELAATRKGAGLILESSFTSARDVVQDTFSWLILPLIWHIQFNNLDKIHSISCPLLVIHSREDTVVPFQHGQRLYEKALEPKHFVAIEGAHYSGKFRSKEMYLYHLRRFAEDYFSIKSTEAF
ncbi:MAG: alpha/beta fold hydrolase [Candidatus Hydrogenedentes bacterium]|jgi:fermentation-respiration switch protein FrsA (DUF1100 family)|nr:alpha/beta fold hydrolase [Candidatus Hydrogenedentota bacterium]